MKIELVKDGKNMRLKLSMEPSGGMGFWGIGTSSAEEELLIPEARRLKDKLEDMIRQAERYQKNAMGIKKLGDY